MTHRERDEIVMCLRIGAAQARKDADAGAVSVRDIHLKTAEYREDLARRLEAAPLRG